MNLSRYQLEKLREDRDFALHRAHQANAYAPSLLVLTPTPQNMGDSYLRRFEHEHSIATELDSTWAIKPLSIVHYGRRMALVLEDPGGRPLEDLLGKPLECIRFLPIAVGLLESLRKLHERGLIHKDVRPANVFLHPDGRVLLTGFGFASRLMRERQPLTAPESLDAALAYIAPERTGRMERSIDARSDLYSLGITLFEMLVGALPFTTADPTELIHCHVARRPPSPSERIAGIPAPLEAVILKLLAKSAEDRYQTAAGVEFDLRRCLASLSTTGQIEPFELGEADVADQLLIPERLYSRETELAALIETFEHVATVGRSGFLFVCGPSGIGKSSIVTELRRAPQARRGLFAEGRADQFRRDVPYASVAEAFRGLLKQILCQDEFQLERWRESLQQALGSSGQLIVDLIPELALIIGAQPTLMNVPPQEERNRFFPVFRRFLSVFARPEHPLVLFLDNFQWLDTATLELLERLAADREVPHLLLIVTCRTDDSDALSDARRMLPLFAADGRAAREIDLAPLTPGDVRDLIAEALRTDAQYVSPLAELVHAKTQGNCFFVRQFLTALNVEGLLQFETASGRWRWDLEGIRAKGITDNVATLMASTLARYDGATLVALKYLACLGASAESGILAGVMQVPVEDVHDAVRSPLNDDLLHRIGARYDFSHDRVREAAYALIPEADKAPMHLRIARLLVSGMDTQAREDGIFELLNHYQQGAALIESDGEKVFLAQLNLMAGKRAKAATAYESALRYFAAGREVLGHVGRDEHYELSFGLEFYEADCKFITGDLDFAREQLVRLVARSRSETDRALVVGRQVMLFTFLGEIDHALHLAIECLAQIGEVFPLYPSDGDVQKEYLDLLQVLGTRSAESLITLPPMANPQLRGVMELLGVLSGPAGAVHLNLLTLVQLRMVRLSVEHGTTDESAHAYAGLTRVLGWSFGELDLGHDFGRLALRFVEERGSSRSAERVYSVLAGCMAPYTMSLRATHDLAVRATEVARELGGITFAGHSWSLAVNCLFDAGEPLTEVQRCGQAARAVVLEQKFFAAVKMVEIPLMLARALRGLNAEFGSFTSGETTEAEFEKSLLVKAHRHSVPRYWTRKLQLRYYAGDFATCLEAISIVENGLVSAPVYELTCELWFFSALARAAVLTDLPRGEWGALFDALLANHRKLEAWAARHPTNFADRACLVAAEIARLEGRTAEAGKLYEEAIRLAGQYEFVQNVGLANELAARFYAPLGLHAIAAAYVRNARIAYSRWGADGKVRQLEQCYPYLADAASGRNVSKAEIKSRLQRLDVAAIIDMHQAVSRELVLDKLIERLMITVVEHAGAVRGLLLLAQEGEMRIRAEAVTGHNSVIVHLRHQPATIGELPQSVLNYVVRAQDHVILDDAQAAPIHSVDEYVLRVRPRSVLCLPLMRKTRLVGVLYLENTLSPRVFTADRLAVLQLLASQAAISIENAMLFRDIQKAQEQARIAMEELRRYFDMMPTLAWRASPDGVVDFVNQRWLAYSGFTMEDVGAGRWDDVFHPDDKQKVWTEWRRCITSGDSGEIEARMRRFDGAYRMFLVRAIPMLDEQGRVVMWHGTNTDIESIRRAEQAQEILARASRLTAMGELTVSIAHEMSQPLMAIETNATTCMRWLADEQFDVAQARSAANRIVGDVHRARDVIASIRRLARKATPETTQLDLNGLIVEVLELTSNEIERHGIALQKALERDVAPVLGVRVQLQQVVLNLVLNGIEAIVAAKTPPRQLRIRSARSGGGVMEVSIADTGVGVDPENREKIFDAFFTTKPEGLGMGLSICRTIVEAHGGRLWVAPNPERGSIFSFVVPLLSEHTGAAHDNAGLWDTLTPEMPAADVALERDHDC